MHLSEVTSTHLEFAQQEASRLNVEIQALVHPVMNNVPHASCCSVGPATTCHDGSLPAHTLVVLAR